MHNTLSILTEYLRKNRDHKIVIGVHPSTDDDHPYITAHIQDHPDGLNSSAPCGGVVGEPLGVEAALDWLVLGLIETAEPGKKVTIGPDTIVCTQCGHTDHKSKFQTTIPDSRVYACPKCQMNFILPGPDD